VGDAPGDGARLAVLPEAFVSLYPLERMAKGAAGFGGWDALWARGQRGTTSSRASGLREFAGARDRRAQALAGDEQQACRLALARRLL
jgi:predicted amidohydrolase